MRLPLAFACLTICGFGLSMCNSPPPITAKCHIIEGAMYGGQTPAALSYSKGGKIDY